MKLQTKQLKKFKQLSTGMKQNNILPILSYLKFDNGTVTKNNMESFIVMDIECEGALLIDERLLMSMVDSTGSDTITATLKGDSVILSDGKTKKVSPTSPVLEFPVNASADAEYIDLLTPVLYAVKVASSFTSENPAVPYTEHVFIGKGNVAASNNFTAYIEKVATGLPEIVLTREAAFMAGRFETLQFSQSESYHFFKADNFVIGFGKKETKFLDMSQFLTAIECGVQIGKSEIIKFCQMVLSDAQGRAINGSFEKGIMVASDDAYGYANETPLSVELPDFTFNPTYMLQLLKSVPDEVVTITSSKNKLIVTGESGFFSLIMQVVNI